MEKQFIPRKSAGGPTPLSSPQLRLWFLDQLEPNSYLYNSPRGWRLIGELSVDALQRALAAVVDRHQALRTNFVAQGDMPVQLLRESWTLEIPVDDLSTLPSSERETELQRRLCAEAQRPFNLTRDLMLRARLYRLAADQHVLLCTMHHIATDGWSFNNLFEEAARFYNSWMSNTPASVPDLPIQYADYALWQRNCLTSDALRRQLAYWSGKLKGAPGLITLPCDRPRPAVQSYAGARRSLPLPPPLVKGLGELSRNQHVTLFMTMLAAWQALLRRYSNETDIVTSFPIAGRKHLETEKLIGLFVNTLVLRTDLSGDPTFLEVLGRVNANALEAYEHDDLPFEKLVEELQPERNLSYAPISQVMFAFELLPEGATRFSGLDMTPVVIDPKVARFDLILFVVNSGESLEAVLEYCTDLFHDSTAERMLGHYLTLLEGIAANPEQRIGELPLLTDREKQQLLVVWNQTKVDYPAGQCIHRLFEEQAERTPDAMAVVHGDQQLSYRLLNERANQLANYLQRLGVGPEVLVGICLERSLEMIVGVLAILKAGGAYLPLDPGYPQERLAFMLKDSQAVMLLTQARLGALTSGFAGARIFLDHDRHEIARERTVNTRSQPSAGSLAYVIYTSGSTGTPKGVAIEHRNTVALLHWAKSVFSADDIAGVLASTSICFDLSVFELFVPLCWGGTVILVENALDLRQTSAKPISLLNTVPSVVTSILAAGSLPESIRVVNLAGEPLRSELVDRLYQSGTVEKVYDLYGPTETTTYSTFTLRSKNGPTTIGRPIANTRIFLLDSNGQPVPVGVAGEIYIGGDGLARGYLNRPELTREKFLANPFSPDPPDRLYKTGDLARYGTDGNIEYLGRADTQVKIRGYRIELGEVEATLAQHPAVRESVVVCREDSPGERRLVAYAVLKSGSLANANELRRDLQQKLPGYMVPSAIVFLPSVPLTANGKVDRSALPKPNGLEAQMPTSYLAPRNPMEQLIAGIWREVLGREQIGVNDNFFDLGGHSLKAMQVVARMRKALASELPLRHLFEYPTIAELAAAITASPEKPIASTKNPEQLLSEIEAMLEDEAQQRLRSLIKKDKE